MVILSVLKMWVRNVGDGSEGNWSLLTCDESHSGNIEKVINCLVDLCLPWWCVFYWGSQTADVLNNNVLLNGSFSSFSLVFRCVSLEIHEASSFYVGMFGKIKKSFPSVFVVRQFWLCDRHFWDSNARAFTVEDTELCEWLIVIVF